MNFQTLDDKGECVGIYANGALHFDIETFPPELNRTWKYVPYLKNHDIEFASLYLEGEPLEKHIPEYLRDDWEDVVKKINSFKRSLEISKVDMGENCIFDLMPHRFLIEYCGVKEAVTEHIFKTVSQPDRYEFYKHVSCMLGDIENRRVRINSRKLKSLSRDPKNASYAKTIMSYPYVCYNQFGTKTGRLTTKRNTFPILTLNKTLRSAIEPTNDFFVEFDFNGAEVRTLLGLLGKPQPDEDVHEFHLKEVFKKLNTRSEAKVAFFAWLYGSSKAASSQESSRLAKFYEKQKLLQKYWVDGSIKTFYGKRIHNVSNHHALNYLVQSTAAELALKQFLKMNYLIENRSSKSHVSFLIHDAIVIDMSKEDMHLLKPLATLMESTNFGKFKINIKKGKNLGSLKECQIG